MVISCTGSVGTVLLGRPGARLRDGSERPLAVVDLALPHDVAPGVAELPGVLLIGLASLAHDINEGQGATDVDAVRAIVAEEVKAFLAARRSASVTPTVVALRTMATGVVDTELQRLAARLPDLDAAARAEVEQTVRRVADKLLHQPTVRVKELANEDGAVSYAEALAELSHLDPEAVDAVTRAGGRMTRRRGSGRTPSGSAREPRHWPRTQAAGRRSPTSRRASAATSSWSRSRPRAT